MILLRNIPNLFVLKGQSIDETRKRSFLSLCIILIIPFLSLFTIEDFISNRIYESLVVLVIILIFFVNLFALKYFKNMDTIYRFDAFFVLLLLCYLLAIGSGQAHSFLWYYIFPLTIFYLVGKKEGIIWVGTSLLLAGFFFLTPLFYEYKLGISLRFLITYSIVSILSFGLESSRNRYYQDLLNEKKMLEGALIEVKKLKGLLPICSFCKRIRDDKGYWNQIESYIHQHSEAEFSHGICPECAKKHYSEFDLYGENKS